MTTTPKTFIYPEYYIQEDWGLVTQSSTESVDLGLTSSPATEHEDFGLVVTTQQELQDYQDQRQFLYDLDNAVEKTTYDYNDRAIVPAQSPDDYGSIADAVTENIDYGSIADAQTETADYRYIYYQGDAYPYGTVEISGSALYEPKLLYIHRAFGTVEFSGIKVEKNTFSEIGSGFFSAINGAAEATGSNPPDSTVLFELSGTKVEKNTYSYNERAIFVYGGYDDYGLIANAIDEPVYDYGLIINAIDEPVEDYGTLGTPFNETVYPYGTAEFSGSAPQSFIPTTEIGSGSAEFSGIKVEKNTFREIGSGSFSAINGAAEATGSNPPDSTLLFELSGTKVEKNTYSYNERAIFVYEGYDDHGVITVVQDYDDYGLLSDQVVYEDYGTLSSPFNETTYPYGTAEFSGSAPQSFIPTTEIGSGSAEFSGIKVEKNAFREIGSGLFSAIGGSAEATGSNPPDSTVLFELSGTKVEKNTYSYNERAIFVYEGYDDYGLITNSIDEPVEDYGLVSNIIDEPVEDYGTLGTPFNETVYPYGTVEVSGASVSEFVTEFIHNATGTIQVSGELGQSETSVFIGSGSFSAFSGSAEATGSNPPDSTVLFELSGTKVEKNTYSYNERSILPSQPSADYGSIADSVTESVDYGLITDSELTGGVEDYRYIYYGTDAYPYGTIEVTGSALYEPKLLYVHRASGTVEFSGSAPQSFIPTTEIGSGSFSTIGGSAEATGSNPPDSTLLFELSGTKVEKNTYSYNERAIFVYGGIDDYGLIANAIDEPINDYGLIINAIDEPVEDYGTLGTPFNETVYPYGTVEVSGSITQDVQVYVPVITGSGSIEISGSAPQSFIPTTEIGSGFFSAINGAAEATGSNPPDSTVLFELSGTKVERSAYSHFGSGSVEFSGSAIIQVNLNWFGSGTAEFSGSAPQSFIPTTEIGSGSFSAFSGSAEAVGANPPDSTLLFELSGTKVEKSTFREIGSGSAEFAGSATNIQNVLAKIASGSAELSGTKVEKSLFREIGSGSFSAFSGSAEAVGANPPDSTVLFEFSGTKVEKNTFREIGFGLLTFTGEGTAKKNPGFAGRGSVEFSGSAPQSFIPTTEIGSGSFSAFSGSAEAVGANPPDSTVLFEISGTKVERNSYSHFGSGTLAFTGNAIVSLEVLSIHVGTGLLTLSGSAPQSFIPTTEIGSGSFSAIIGSAEAVGVNPPDSTLLFEISGSYSDLKATYAHQGTGILSVTGTAVEKSLPSHEGSGTLSAITGAAESTLSNPPDSTVLFEFSGTKIEKNTFREIGSGSFSAIIGSVESVGANPPENTVLFELSGTKVEKSTFREIGSGSVQVLGNSLNIPVYIHKGSGSAVFSGVSPQSFTPATEIGSGLFSAIGGSAEVVGANPPENTVLFELSGTKVEKSTFREIGSGSVEFSGSMTQDVQVYVPSITGSGIVSISGTGIDKFRPNYKATGTITIVGNGRESYTPTTEIGSGSIQIDGVGIGTYIIYRQPYVYVTII